MHPPAMDDWLWYIRFYLSAAAFLGSFLGIGMWLTNRIMKRLDNRTTAIVGDIFKDLSVTLMEYFNAQLTERDKRITMITETMQNHEMRMARFEHRVEETLTWHSERLTDLAIAGTTVATIALYPTPMPSKREKDRAINEFQKLIIQKRKDIEPKGD